MDDHDVLLPLNCVDAGFLALISTEEYPQFHWILKIEGQIDTASLNQAILAVLQVHPHLRAKACVRHMRAFRRIEDASKSTVLTHLDLCQQKSRDRLSDEAVNGLQEAALQEWFNRPLDPFTEFPVRALLIRKTDAESYLVFTFDHSALDGLRALLFMKEVITSYSGGIQPERAFLGDIRRSKGDELLGFARGKRTTTRAFYRRIFSSLSHRIFITPVKPPSRVFHDRSERSGAIAYRLDSIGQTELEEIRAKVKTAGFTVNDVLLAACFRAIDRWNGQYRRAHGKITIMVPVNIGPEAFRDVISNQLCYVSLTTRPGERSEPRALLWKTRRDMRAMIDNGIAFSMVYFLHFASRAPFPMFKALAKLVMFTRIYVDTILLSNLGTIWRKEWGDWKMGSAAIKDVTLIMPVVTPMGLSLGTHTFNDRLHVCLSYKTALFSQEKAQEFLDLYLEEVRKAAAGAIPEPRPAGSR